MPSDARRPIGFYPNGWAPIDDPAMNQMLIVGDSPPDDTTAVGPGEVYLDASTGDLYKWQED